MASVMNVKEIEAFCNDVFTQLSDIRNKIVALEKRSSAGGMLNDIDGGKFIRQLEELADQIDWKLQIMSHSCSYDWKGSDEYDEHGDNTVSVGPAEKAEEDFSPGYLGG